MQSLTLLRGQTTTRTDHEPPPLCDNGPPDAAQLLHLIERLMVEGWIRRPADAESPRRLVLQEVLEQAIATVSALFDRGRHELRVEYLNDPVFVHSDPESLRNAFTELLRNSATYTPAGGLIRVSVRTTVRGFAQVRISDTGTGIPKDLLHDIFTMFRRPERTRELAAGRLGIGLGTVKGSVERSGGSVRVDSEGVGQGTTFTIILPTTRDRAHQTDSGKSKHEAHASTGSARRILVIDSSRGTTDPAIGLLYRAGYEIQFVHDLEHAIGAVRHWQPEGVMIDLEGSGPAGLDFARRLGFLGLEKSPVVIPLGAVTTTSDPQVSEGDSSKVSDLSVYRERHLKRAAEEFLRAELARLGLASLEVPQD